MQIKNKITNAGALPVLTLLFLLSAVLRLHTNFASDFMPGANGAYYIVQVRSLFEKGELLFSDYPLLFWLQLLLAHAIKLLFGTGVSESVILASKTFDGIIPPLSVFPAYYLIKEMYGGTHKLKTVLLFASVSIFYVSFFILTSDFQKNAFALLWLFSLMLMLYRSFSSPSAKNILLAVLFFLLTGLSHFGVFTVAVFFLVVLFAVKMAGHTSWKKILKYAGIIVVVAAAGYLIIYLISPFRAMRASKFFGELLSYPVIATLFSGRPTISQVDLFNIMFINMATLPALLFYIARHKKIDYAKRAFIAASIIAALFLSSPLLGVEWAQRLYFMAYVFVVPLLPFVYESAGDFHKNIVTGIVLLVLLVSVIIFKSRPVQSNMNTEIYSELNKISGLIREKDNTLIVARHGMEFWTAWITRANVSREESLYRGMWNNYKEIYILRQKKFKPPFGPFGLVGPPFREPYLLQGTVLYYEGKIFDLYKSTLPPEDMSVFIERYK